MYWAPYSQRRSFRGLFCRPWHSFVILLAFLVNSLGPIPMAHADDFYLPAPGVMVRLSPPLDPPMLKGIKVHPENPFRFDFILDQGDSGTSSKTEATRLIKYFLASLTIPEKDLWVNLSPYEKDRIIPQSFGLTEMGRDLLAEDYMLKQITASLIYPEDKIGKKFWKRIYEEAQERFGTTNIPVNTFNKVWIVPEKAVVYENVKTGTAYIVEAKLKVMLEQDYLSLQKHITVRSDVASIGSNIVREVVIPELNREVNEDKNFAQLRQVYNSLILATWYKKTIKDSILEQVYADKNKVAGIGHNHNDVELIYQRYLQAFKKGAYNYIKEEVDPSTQETVPRKYFSGGTAFTSAAMVSALSFNTDPASISQPEAYHSEEIDVNLLPGQENRAMAAVRSQAHNERELISNKIRQFEWAKEIGDILQAPHVSQSDLRTLGKQLKHTDSLDQILGISLTPAYKSLYATYKETVFQYQDFISVFRWPGSTSDQLGLKDLNDVIDQEQVNVIIRLIRETLKEKMDELRRIKGADLGKEEFQEALLGITHELSKIVTDKLSEDPFKTSLKQRNIPLVDKGKELFRIDVGTSQLEIDPQASDEEMARSRVLAVINAGIAIVMNQSRSVEEGSGSIIFDQGEFDKKKQEWKSLMLKLDALPLWAEHQNTFVLQEDIVKVLRKRIDWKKLPVGLQERLGGETDGEKNYADLNRYFVLTGLVDYIKQWQVDFQAARLRSQKIKEVMEGLEAVAQRMDSTSKKNVQNDQYLRVLLSDARQIIAQDPRFLEADSELSLFSQVSKARNPGFIMVDIINMGGQNFREFEVLMKKISETDDRDEIDRLLMTAADKVTIDFQRKLSEVKSLLRRKHIDLIGIKMGGDEITVVVSEYRRITPQLLIEIKKITSGRVYGTQGIVNAKKNFKKRERVTFNKRDRKAGDSELLLGDTAPNWLAWAKMLLSLDHGINLLKSMEYFGKGDVVLMGDKKGRLKTISSNSQAMISVKRSLHVAVNADGLRTGLRSKYFRKDLEALIKDPNVKNLVIAETWHPWGAQIVFFGNFVWSVLKQWPHLESVYVITEHPEIVRWMSPKIRVFPSVEEAVFPAGTRFDAILNLGQEDIAETIKHKITNPETALSLSGLNSIFYSILGTDDIAREVARKNLRRYFPAAAVAPLDRPLIKFNRASSPDVIFVNPHGVTNKDENHNGESSQRWADLIDQLLRNGYKVALNEGGVIDEPLTNEIRQKVGENNNFVVPKLGSTEELVNYMAEHARAVVTQDSGPLHAAYELLGVPTVVVTTANTRWVPSEEAGRLGRLQKTEFMEENGAQEAFKKLEELLAPVSKAMEVKEEPLRGGIDLTPAKMNLQTKIDAAQGGPGIKFHLDPALLEQLQSAPGFVPVIIDMHPVTDIRLFLGIKEASIIQKT